METIVLNVSDTAVKPPVLPGLAEALIGIGRWLLAQNYRFITPTPLSHSRVLSRNGRAASALRDVFGWSLPFHPQTLPHPILQLMQDASLIHSGKGLKVSKVRFSSIDDKLFAHSAYPTSDADAVFFGPDTYRFVNLIKNELMVLPLQEGDRILDMGCGGGAGGIVAALATDNQDIGLVLADSNPQALIFAQANAALAGLHHVKFAVGDLFDAVHGNFDRIFSNPPYLMDEAMRTYRHGGGEWGSELSKRIVCEALPRLNPGGQLVLYTGAVIVDGVDVFQRSIQPLLQSIGWPSRYWELDPDVFGEELEEHCYSQAERIAAVALVVQRPGA